MAPAGGGGNNRDTGVTLGEVAKGFTGALVVLGAVVTAGVGRVGANKKSGEGVDWDTG